MVPSKPLTMMGPMKQQQAPAQERARIVPPKQLSGRPQPQSGHTLQGVGPFQVRKPGQPAQQGNQPQPYMGEEKGAKKPGGFDRGPRPNVKGPWSPDPEHKWEGMDQKPLPGSKVLTGPGSNILGAFLSAQAHGGATMSYLGGPQIARLHIGRAVSGVHGLLNRKTPHAYESARMGREALLQRQQMIRRQGGEGGGVVTQSGMPGSRNPGAGGFGMGMSTPGGVGGFRRSLPAVEGQAIMVRSGIKRIKNG